MRVSKKAGKRGGVLAERNANALGGLIFYREEFGDDAIAISETLSKPVVQSLVSSGLLIGFHLGPIRPDGSLRIDLSSCTFSSTVGDGGAIPPIKPESLSYFTLLSCARLWLEINDALRVHGLCLGDAHLGNFGFDSRLKPIWLDLDSIIPIRHGAEGFIEFRRTFVRPLIAMRRWPSIAPLIRLGIGKITATSFRAMSKLPSLSYRGYEVSSGIPVYLSRKVRFGEMFGRGLRLILLRLNGALLPRSRKGPRTDWAHYIRQSPYDTSKISNREEVVARVGESPELRTVLDLGGNEGRFAWLVAKEKSFVHLVDTEDSAISTFCEHIANLSNETSDLIERPAFLAQVGDIKSVSGKYDLVLMLALTHHLVLSQHWSFNQVAEFAKSLTKHTLLIEFMPNGVGAMQSTYPLLPEWYTEEEFVNALSRNFADVSFLGHFEPGGRKLYECRVQDM